MTHFLKNHFSVYLYLMYPCEFEINGTTETRSASYIDLFHNIDRYWWLQTRINDKRDNFTFPIVNFPLLSRNKLSSHRIAFTYLNWNVTLVHNHTTQSRMNSLHKKNDWDRHFIISSPSHIWLTDLICLCLILQATCFHSIRPLNTRTVVLSVVSPIVSYSRLWYCSPFFS